ncbi:hypothetical protein STEG23_021080, partial [Scotinomys teguina]
GKCEQSLYGHIHAINDATFASKGHIIASCDARGVTKLWDFRKLVPIVSIDVGPSSGNEVNFDSTDEEIDFTYLVVYPCSNVAFAYKAKFYILRYKLYVLQILS